MKLVIEKEYNTWGGGWLIENEVVAELYKYENNLLICVDGVRYCLPIIAVRVVIEDKKEE